jgi:hypothetical protein
MATKQDGSRGLVFRWDTLRLLYFFGGNGEARLRIDAHGVSSTIRVPADSPQAAADSYQVLDCCVHCVPVNYHCNGPLLPT